MSLFADNFAAAAVPNLMIQFGDAVIYYAPGALALDRLTMRQLGELTLAELGALPLTAGLALTAIVGQQRVEVDEAQGESRRLTVRTLTITTDPESDYGGVAAPSERALVEIDDVDYAVRDGSIKLGDGLAEMELVRAGAAEIGRSGYRRR